MVKLYDLMGTRYITDDHCTQMRTILDSAKDTIDLADCKFTVHAELALRDYYATVNFVNTAQSIANGILEFNNRSARAIIPEMVPLNTSYFNAEEAMDIIAKRDSNKIYYLETLGFGARNAALVILFIMKAPDIRIDVGVHGKEIFNMFRESWLPVAKPHKQYYRLEGNAIVRQNVVEGYVRDFNGKKYSEDEYIRIFNVVPSEFGNKVLIETDDAGEALISDEYEPVVDAALKVVSKELIREPKMLDYINMMH